MVTYYHVITPADRDVNTVLLDAERQGIEIIDHIRTVSRTFEPFTHPGTILRFIGSIGLDVTDRHWRARPNPDCTDAEVAAVIQGAIHLFAKHGVDRPPSGNAWRRYYDRKHGDETVGAWVAVRLDKPTEERSTTAVNRQEVDGSVRHDAPEVVLSTEGGGGLLIRSTDGAPTLAFALLKAARVADMASGVAHV